MLLSEIFEHLQPRRWLAITFTPTSSTTRARGSAKRPPDKTVDLCKAGDNCCCDSSFYMFDVHLCSLSQNTEDGGSSSRTMT